MRLLQRDLLEVSRPLFCCERVRIFSSPALQLARLFRVAGVAGHRRFVFLLAVRRPSVWISSSSVHAAGMADVCSANSKHRGWAKVWTLAAVSKVLESLGMAEG